MIPASTNGLPVGAITAATCSTVAGLMALQSTKTGFALLTVSAGTRCCASASASPGGRIDRMKSAPAISSLAEVMPAAFARATVAALRPASEVSTAAPRSVSRFPTPAPIAPGAMMATTGGMASSFNKRARMHLAGNRAAMKCAAAAYTASGTSR